MALPLRLHHTDLTTPSTLLQSLLVHHTEAGDGKSGKLHCPTPVITDCLQSAILPLTCLEGEWRGMWVGRKIRFVTRWNVVYGAKVRIMSLALLAFVSRANQHSYVAPGRLCMRECGPWDEKGSDKVHRIRFRMWIPLNCPSTNALSLFYLCHKMYIPLDCK